MVLPIVQTGDPILRGRASELSLEELRSKDIQDLIERMRETMRDAPGVGLAAPQIGLGIRLVVIEDPAELQSKLDQDELKKRQREPIPFHVLVNPQLTIEGDETVEFFEGCLSVEGFTALTARYTSVKVHAWDEHGHEFSRRATGWYARILQHECDHLNGILYIDRMQTRTFSTTENKTRFWEVPPRVVREQLGVDGPV